MAMEKDKKDLLNVIQGADAEEEIPVKKEETKKSGFALPEGYLLAKEMQELFEEDIVTHVQGPSEPEAD
jgi:hypothetical protein